jgi:hypothetical protein
MTGRGGRRMPEMVRYRLLVLGLIVGYVVFKLLALVAAWFFFSAAGLLMMGFYGHALLVLIVGIVVYEGSYWLLVGRWAR